MGKITWQRRLAPFCTLQVYYVILKVKKEINQIVWRHKNKKVQALQSQR